MKKIDIGDKVRFLNDVGGGIVVSFINHKVVNVLQEDGFELPVLISECVVVDKTKKTDEPKSTTIINKVSELNIIETSDGDNVKIFLAFVPSNESIFPETNLDIFLINDSNFYLMMLTKFVTFSFKHYFLSQ